jgi:hypothetical protein
MTHQLDAPNVPDQPILFGLVELPDDGGVLFVLNVGLGVDEGCYGRAGVGGSARSGAQERGGEERRW